MGLSEELGELRKGLWHIDQPTDGCRVHRLYPLAVEIMGGNKSIARKLALFAARKTLPIFESVYSDSEPSEALNQFESCLKGTARRRDLTPCSYTHAAETKEPSWNIIKQYSRGFADPGKTAAYSAAGFAAAAAFIAPYEPALSAGHATVAYASDQWNNPAAATEFLEAMQIERKRIERKGKLKTRPFKAVQTERKRQRELALIEA
jgi:hypothetical protein